MKKRYRYFFSPQPSVEINEYIDNFFNTLAQKVEVINHGKKPASRSADFFKYMFRADVMILNWPEDILHLRFGVAQLFASFITLALFKLKGGKVVWVCHNKDSHNKKYKLLRKLTRSFYTKISDVIIVHSNDALSFFLKEKQKAYFLNHPVYLDPPLLAATNTANTSDVLIWGRINPYKGLHDFIESYKKHNNLFNVKIVGNANKSYFETISQAASGLHIDITSKFLSNEEIAFYFQNSKIILLPYADSDTFSSGALIHSLSSNKIVIGPAIGNFIDLNQKNACLVYENFTELFSLLNSLLKNQSYYDNELARLREGISEYYKLNTWEKFIDEIVNIAEGNNKLPESNKKIVETVNAAS